MQVEMDKEAQVRVTRRQQMGMAGSVQPGEDSEDI